MINQNVLNELIINLKLKHSKIQELLLEHCTDINLEYIQLILIKIKTSQRNKGYGSAVMSDLLSFADTQNVQIRLYMKDVYELKRLQGFYTKQGFVLIKNSVNKEMVYYPKKINKK